MKIYSLLLLLGLIMSCKMAKKESPPAKSVLAYTFLTKEAQTNPQIRGIWKSIGNGYFLEIREDSLLLYSYTQSFCYKEKNDYLEGLLMTESQFNLRGDTLAIYLTDYGEQTQYLQTKKDFVRIGGLPKNCLTFSEMTQLRADEQFRLYQETLVENYAFQEERQLEWAAIFEAYQDSISSDDNSLFEYMGKVATLCKDQHTKVIASNGTSLQYRVTPSALEVQKAFEQQTEVKDLGEYFNLFFSSSKRNISDSLLAQKGKKVLNGNIEWGRISDQVGYINRYSFAGFLNRNHTRAQQIDSIKTHMNEIIDSLQTSEAIIVDVSFNFGGFDASALAIAGYFAAEPVYAFSSQVYQNGEFYKEDDVIVYPAEKSFTKPVYLIMTDVSRSAAEGFAMMMDALPQVKLAGTNTLGTLSGMLGKSIQDFYTTYSNQRLINAAGKYFEVTGVQPDIEIPVFPKENVMEGHLHAVRKIVEIIEQK